MPGDSWYASPMPRARTKFGLESFAEVFLGHKTLEFDGAAGGFSSLRGRDFAARRTEFSWRAVILGSIFGILFGAVSVYVGLRAGLTVSASIPISVLSISILRAFGKSTILENNIVQTTGSAGESVAAGVIFTLPALIFLGFSLNTEYWRVFFLALLGGWLGVLLMIPLRRQLIVKEHGNLTFPEGTACADVLVAGERGGSFASRVFWGLGLGGVYTFCMNTLGMWPGQPEYRPNWLPGASFRTAITSEYLWRASTIGPARFPEPACLAA